MQANPDFFIQFLDQIIQNGSVAFINNPRFLKQLTIDLYMFLTCITLLYFLKTMPKKQKFEFLLSLIRNILKKKNSFKDEHFIFEFCNFGRMLLFLFIQLSFLQSDEIFKKILWAEVDPEEWRNILKNAFFELTFARKHRENLVPKLFEYPIQDRYEISEIMDFLYSKIGIFSDIYFGGFQIFSAFHSPDVLLQTFADVLKLSIRFPPTLFLLSKEAEANQENSKHNIESIGKIINDEASLKKFQWFLEILNLIFCDEICILNLFGTLTGKDSMYKDLTESHP